MNGSLSSNRSNDTDDIGLSSLTPGPNPSLLAKLIQRLCGMVWMRWDGMVIMGCYWQTVPPQWNQGKLFGASPSFFFSPGSSETKSQKINPKVRNEPSLLGLQTGRWQNLGWYGKKRPLLGSHHVLAMTGNN